MPQAASAFEKYIRVQPKGLITIPKKLRQDLSINEQSIVKIKREGNKLIIESVRPISYPVRSYSKKEIKKFLTYDATQTKELKKKSLL